ncbi:MAG: hypothetical protein LBI70_01775 [Rickettsiales bacterium]|jgi:hypothetical protein|nr:hypothetical protein [Rickettsiales bacterium]
MKYSRPQDLKIRQLIECFCLDVVSIKTSMLLHINQNTINGYFALLYNALTNDSMVEGEKGKPEAFKLDESYFEARGIGKKIGKRTK